VLVNGRLGSPDVSTLTPSDRAEAAAGTRAAAIPPQRAGQTLRLLILGGGTEADALRVRAAAVGIELAQRFSSRVTHVIVDADVPDDDSRLARARSAGLPVLCLADCSELLGLGQYGDSTSAEAAEAAVVGTAAAEAEVEASTDTDASDASDASDAPDAPEPLLLVESVESTGPDDPAGLADLADLTEQVADASTSLGAAPFFPPPPLPPQVAVGYETSDLGILDPHPGLAAETVIETAAEPDAPPAVFVFAPDVISPDLPAATAVATPAIAPIAPTTTASRSVQAASIAWALVPLVSLGLLTPVVIGYGAYRLRSRLLAAVTACYAFAVAAAFTVSAASPAGTRPHSAVGDLLTTSLAVAWLGGTAHAFALRHRVFR
jgi:hypothetical protein